jgi:hypothetical protein
MEDGGVVPPKKSRDLGVTVVASRIVSDAPPELVTGAADAERAAVAADFVR